MNNFGLRRILAIALASGCLAAGTPCAHAAATTAPLSDTDWLKAKTSELLIGSRVRADDGSWLYTPDGKGNYKALWTRDFAYMVENAGDLMPQEEVEACLRHLINGIRADGAAPDRVQPDGLAVYAGGPVNHPLGEPNLDNPPFLIIAVDEYLKRLPRKHAENLFNEWAAALDKTMDWVPRSASGLVSNNPAKPHSPYGFTDTIGKTGELFFESLLYWTASRRMATRHRDAGNSLRAKEYRLRANLIERNLGVLWDEKSGAFFAATHDCRQLDIWGNAYAIWLDFPLSRRKQRVLDFLHANHDRYLWRGQVRHLFKGEYWQRLLAPVEPERYQNGAYWATASGWVIWALAARDQKLAHNVWSDLIADFRANGICECVNEGYRKLPSYVVSATNPLAAARRLKY